MKRKTLTALIAVFVSFALALLGGCASSRPSGLDELDLAVRDASDYLNDNLPKGSKIVILNIQCDSAALSDYIIDELIANAVNDKIFTVVDRQQLNLIRTEQGFQLSGEVDDKTAVEVGKFFGAQTIVSGRVSEIADRYRMNIRALNVQTAQVQGQYNRNIPPGKTIVALMNSRGGSGARTTSASTTAAARASETPTARQTAPAVSARPSHPPNGTYTFYPRLRAIQGAVPSRVYLDRVVSRNGYLAFYLVSSAVGKGGGAGNPWVGSGSSEVYLQDLDNPSRVWNIRSQEMDVRDEVGGSMITFEGVTGRRFLLNSGSGYINNVPMIFEEIILETPDKN